MEKQRARPNADQDDFRNIEKSPYNDSIIFIHFWGWLCAILVGLQFDREDGVGKGKDTYGEYFASLDLRITIAPLEMPSMWQGQDFLYLFQCV